LVWRAGGAGDLEGGALLPLSYFVDHNGVAPVKAALTAETPAPGSPGNPRPSRAGRGSDVSAAWINIIIFYIYSAENT